MRSLFAILFALSVSSNFFFSPSALAKVDTAKTAVIVVDMQDGFYERGGVTGSVGLQNLVNRQIELLKWAESEKVPVLFFEYESFGETDPRLTSVIAGGNAIRITKNNDNGFAAPSKKPAVAFLKKNGIETIIMAGINGAACVYETTKGAIASGFDVVTSSDIVGNLNQNPPIYPNNTWYFMNNKLEIMPNLDAIIF